MSKFLIGEAIMFIVGGKHGEINPAKKVSGYFLSAIFSMATLFCQSADAAVSKMERNVLNMAVQDADGDLWMTAKASKNENILREYIDLFPSGRNINEAKLRLRLIRLGIIK